MFGLFNTKPKTYQNIDTDTFQELMKEKGEVKIVDVRSDMEYRQGHIPGAKLLNMMSGDFQSQLMKLPKDKKLLLYCRSGNRSGKAAQKLGNAGFEEVYNLRGGLMYWDGPLQ
jgi:rhodanese-related sulfurtransferase